MCIGLRNNLIYLVKSYPFGHDSEVITPASDLDD